MQPLGSDDPARWGASASPHTAYGEAVRFGPTVCASRETGVRCDNASTGHGFTPARAQDEVF